MVDRLAADGKDQSLASLKTMFGEGFFKQVMSANLMMPQKPVEPGDSWPVEIEVPMEGVGTLMVNYTYTFQNWERHGQRMCARLNHQGTVTTKPGSAATAAGFSMDIQDGDSTGTTWFDPDLGIAIDATATQNFKMLMQVPVPSPGGKPPRMQSIKNDMQQVMSVKLVSVK